MAMTDEEKEIIIDEVLSITEDYKANVIAAELVEHGFPIDDIYFKNVSIFRRFISKDVNDVLWDENDNGPDQLVFELNREGLYDMLPEGLIHSKSQRRPAGEAQNEFAVHRKQEEHTRKFFSSFENEFLHSALQLEIIERELYNSRNANKTREFFEIFYGNSRFLTDTQVLTLLYILPLSNKIRADVKIISETLTKILKYKITVVKQKNKPQVLKVNSPVASLNNCFLGIDSVISDSCVVHSFCYDLIVYDIGYKEYGDFRKNGKCSNVINFVLPYFFPVSAEINLVLLPDEPCKYLKLSTPGEVYFLGFNSYI
jgi:hypothetical protein